MRPKWLLTMPCGSLMLEKAISKIDISNFERIIVVCLQEHVDKYLDFDKFIKRIQTKIFEKIEVVILKTTTKSQSETISECIKEVNIKGPIFIKDCDNEFKYSFGGKNEISVINLKAVNLIDAKNKSYVQTNDLNIVFNIAEKQVISNSFCCGGYGFKNAEDFMMHYQKLQKNIDGEIYISHVIHDMILSGENFEAINASEYIDWGTKKEYLTYTQKHVTVFCDIDGVLLENGSAISTNGWKTKPIIENVEALKKLQENGLLYLVITTSRPLSELEYTLECLESVGLKPDNYLFGLPHCKRYLINDFATTNPYPSALAINIDRNSNKLKNLFNFDI
jgi:hypothetical protein